MDNQYSSKVDLYFAYLAGEIDTYPDDPYTRIEIYLYALCKSGIGGEPVSPEEIEEAVNKYLDEHPVQSTPIDDTLTKEGYAADAKAAGDKIAELQTQIDDLKEALTNIQVYTGETVVTPRVAEGTTLNTAKTMVEDDITVEKIPVSDVDNDKGGKTVTIG